VIGQRALRGREGFEIEIAVIVTARGRRGAPFRIAERRLVRAGLAATAVVLGRLLGRLTVDFGRVVDRVDRPLGPFLGRGLRRSDSASVSAVRSNSGLRSSSLST
jgi:hypothetical protein